MIKYKDPPNLEVFAQVYIEAQERLSKKINYEKIKLSEIEDSNQKINFELENVNTLKTPAKKQFVFRVIEIVNLDCEEPVFDIKTETGESLMVNFNDFEKADIIIDIAKNDKKIKVTILHNYNSKKLFFFEINIENYLNRKRIEDRCVTEGINGIEIYYEGQLIFDRIDYLKELITKNNYQEEEFKENIFELSKMKEEIDDLFPRLDFNKFDKNYKGIDKEINPRNSMNLRQSIIQTSLDPREIGLMNANPKTNFDKIPDFSKKEKYAKNEIPLNPFEKHKNDYISDIYDPINKNKVTINWHKFLLYIFILNVVLFVFSIFINYDRTSFLSLVVSSIFCIWFYLKDDFEIYIPEISLIISYSICLVFDSLWLIMVSKNFWIYDFYFNDSSLKGLDKFIVVLSYLIIFVEAALIVLSFFVYKQGIYNKGHSIGTKKEVKILF